MSEPARNPPRSPLTLKRNPLPNGRLKFAPTIGSHHSWVPAGGGVKRAVAKRDSRIVGFIMFSGRIGFILCNVGPIRFMLCIYCRPIAAREFSADGTAQRARLASDLLYLDRGGSAVGLFLPSPRRK